MSCMTEVNKDEIINNEKERRDESTYLIGSFFTKQLFENFMSPDQMWAACFFLLMFSVGMKTLECPEDQEPCGSDACYDPTIERCINESSTVQCLNSCNGICLSSSQYCYNNKLICNNGELVCNVKNDSPITSFLLGLTCYDPSVFVCYDNTICPQVFLCGTQCLPNDQSVCVNNETICDGFDFYLYYPFGLNYLDLCGPQQKCYDNGTSVCLNGTTVCEGSNAQLCGADCFNPDLQVCINDVIQCINSCDDTCYSSSQYCYSNALICNNNELICNITIYDSISYYPLGLRCYDPSRLSCTDGTLCYKVYLCGSQCLTNFNSTCAKNHTICDGFVYYYYYPFGDRYLDLCGPQQQCYDNTTSACLGDNGVVCPIDSQLCSGVCYNPKFQYCVAENGTIYCLDNPSSSDCLPPVLGD